MKPFTVDNGYEFGFRKEIVPKCAALIATLPEAVSWSGGVLVSRDHLQEALRIDGLFR